MFRDTVVCQGKGITGGAMVSVPGFLLRRLYVKGSLKNTPTGFTFTLKNSLGSGYARRMQPLEVDGQRLALESVSFLAEGKQVTFAQVSEQQPFTLAMNRAIAVQVSGAPLSTGPHKITMGFDVPGLGTLAFDFTDVVPA